MPGAPSRVLTTMAICALGMRPAEMLSASASKFEPRPLRSTPIRLVISKKSYHTSSLVPKLPQRSFAAKGIRRTIGPRFRPFPVAPLLNFSRQYNTLGNLKRCVVISPRTFQEDQENERHNSVPLRCVSGISRDDAASREIACGTRRYRQNRARQKDFLRQIARWN